MMAAAYQPQPGGMQHPGMHPHGHPGLAQNQAQHMNQQMMHPGGVSGPGQQHISQAGAMMGMQHGANGPIHPGAAAAMAMNGQPGMGGQSMAGGVPNAQALSHLAPQHFMQQQAHQQQLQQQMQGNPQQAMQLQQQRMLMQRHQQMQMAAQAQAQANGVMNMQPGAMQGLNPQQMAQLQQNNPGVSGVPLTPHLQQQMQQRMQQQAAFANQQQQQQMAQQIAMQQHSSQGQQGPPSSQAQSHAGQTRPQSRMANPNEHGQGQQQHSQPPNQNPQGVQTLQHNAQSTPQPGNANMTQQQAIQLEQVRRQQIAMRQQQQAAHQQMMQARQLQMQHAAQQVQQQQQQPAAGAFILRVLLLADGLCCVSAATGRDLGQWYDFVDKHFSADARLLHSFDDSPNSKPPKSFEVLRPTIARYFWTYFDSGANALKLHTENVREIPMGNGRYQVACANATLTTYYPSGARLEGSGLFNVTFAPTTNLIECFELIQTRTEEIVPRMEIEKVLNTWSPPVESKSPKMTKKALPKAQQKLQQRLEGLTIDAFPKTPKGTLGVTSRLQQFLEIGETFNIMSELMSFSQDKKLRPDAALEALVAQYDSQPTNGQSQINPHINLPQNGVPLGARTPGAGMMQMPQQPGNFSSPAIRDMALPMQANGMNGSPHMGNSLGLIAPNMNMAPNSHTPSPHLSNMAAPPMVPQHSQQGTNSSAASANTSPNMNNKRRRSTVKLEGEDGAIIADGPPANQARIRPSPRMNKKSKPGGAG